MTNGADQTMTNDTAAPPGSAPVRRPVLQEAVVVGVFALPPSSPGVVAGLLGQKRGFFGVEIDRAFAVGVALGPIQDVHGVSVSRAVRGVRPASM
jgi:hypothetical protein